MIKKMLVVAISSTLLACQSAPESKFGVDVINGQHIDQVAADLRTLMDKQQQHDQLLKEWQQLKPAVSRLVVIEEELNLMISQLEQFAIASANTTATPSANVTVANNSAVSPSRVTPQVLSETAEKIDKRFALQITSLSDPLRLPIVWEQMKKKHPTELAKLEPNYEKISVNNTDYYRLKVGAYENKQQAVQSCNQLKMLSINCLVTNYIASDFSVLAEL